MLAPIIGSMHRVVCYVILLSMKKRYDEVRHEVLGLPSPAGDDPFGGGGT